MPWLVAPLLALGVVAAAGPAASAVIYVPGQYRDGVYTHPHFLDAPIKGVGLWLVIGIGCYVFLVRRKYAFAAVSQAEKARVATP